MIYFDDFFNMTDYSLPEEDNDALYVDREAGQDYLFHITKKKFELEIDEKHAPVIEKSKMQMESKIMKKTPKDRVQILDCKENQIKERKDKENITTNKKKSRSLRSEKSNVNHETIVKSKNLTVSKISTKDLKAMEQTAKIWSAIAAAKEKQTLILEEQNCFAASSGVNGKTYQALNNMRTDSYAHRNLGAYKCVDDHNNIQGLMVTEKCDEIQPSYLYVKTLTTHPHNLPASINEAEPDRVNGVGTCLIDCAKIVAQEANCEKIQLESSKVAKGFYERCGFTFSETNNNVVSDIPGVLDLTKSSIIEEKK